MRAASLGRVGLVDSGVRLHDLSERPERDPVPVGQAAALPPGHELRQAVDVCAELGDQPTLPDARLADDRDELHRRGRASSCRRDSRNSRDVGLAADERRSSAMRMTSEPKRAARRKSRATAAHRRGLPLRARSPRAARTRRRRSVARYVPSPTATPPTGAADWIRAAVFTTSPVTMPSPCSGRASSETTASPVFTPTRTDSSSSGSAAFSSAIPSRIARPARTARSAIVLVCHWRAEHGHHGITDELLDRPSEGLDPLPRTSVIRREARLHFLGIRRLRSGREADEVAEEHGHDLALSCAGSGSWRKRGCAEAAELETLRIVTTAGRTSDHAARV